ncbi:MAG: hypothetical protein AAGB14_08140, partial [Verrucomicrobiota bacterium]
MKPLQKLLPLLIAGALAIAAFVIWKLGSPGSEFGQSGATDGLPDPMPYLSDLATPPDWSQIDPWQQSITRAEFIQLMDEVFTVSDRWRDWFLVGDTSVEIMTGRDDENYVLEFAVTEMDATPGPRYWRPASALPPAPSGKPLADLHIAIDPGHIGGRWAKIEERWFKVGDGKPVKEGGMTLFVANLLKPELEKLGAKVSLVRSETEPVTTYRPESLMEAARAKSPDSPQRLAERLFYRTAEIRARAEKVNRELKPDLVLCLHFNAESWGNPDEPTLIP